MIQYIIVGLIIFGSALMVINIIGFVRYARFIRSRENWSRGHGILYIPIALLCMFLVGYLVVGIFGSPDLIVAGILFGGSIFVFIMMLLLNRITQRIIESEHLEAELKAAEESNRAKNAFLASISHEMRTPMNVILGLDELALKNEDLSEETRMQLVKIGRSGRHLLSLINNTLDMQAIETGKRSLKLNPFSLREMMGQIEAIIRTICEEKGLRYHADVSSGIRDGLVGDDMLIRQVLLNLLDNAVKYTAAPGDVTLLVEKVSADTEGCVLRFIVRDTGIGISPEFLPKVFELFSQEDTSFTNRYGGSGMGLAVAKQQVELMSGEISVTSKQGEGTSFTVAIPLVFAGDENTETGRKQAEGTEGDSVSEKKDAEGEPKEEGPDKNADSAEEGSALKKYRILIVEDVDENAEIVTDLLELEGAKVEHAENGLIALGMVERSLPDYYDAILMDLRMPVMDGLEAAAGIRALERPDAKRIPIIALTANAFEIDVENTTKAGMNAHLVKPIDSELLYATLEKWIRKTQEDNYRERKEKGL